MEEKKLVRSRSDKWLGGICGGIARYFGWDAAAIRLIYVFLTLTTAFCGVLAYILLWILMPEDDKYLQ